MTKADNYFKVFCKLSQAFGQAATVDELLTLVVKSATEAIKAKGACLFLADAKQDIFVPMAQSGLSDNYMHANPIKAKMIVNKITKEGFLFFKDATSDPRLENHEAKKAEGIASILSVPVTVTGTTVGILSLYTAKKKEFSQDEIEFLSALADHGGMVIEKARLLERLQKNSMIFLELASAINSSLDIKQVLHNMTEEVCQAFGMKGVTIRLINEDTGDLDLVSSYGLSDEYLQKGLLSAGKSVSDVLKGKTVILQDVANDDRLQYRKQALKEGIASMVCVPIRSKDQTIGVMRLYSEIIRKYPEDFLIMVKALAHTGALAIQNASMYLILKEDQKCLEEDVWRHRCYF